MSGIDKETKEGLLDMFAGVKESIDTIEEAIKKGELTHDSPKIYEIGLTRLPSGKILNGVTFTIYGATFSFLLPPPD